MGTHDMGIDTGWGTEIHMPTITVACGPTVDEARKAFKAALRREKAARKAAKARAKLCAAKARDRELALATFRAVASNSRYSADERVQAAEALLAHS